MSLNLKYEPEVVVDDITMLSDSEWKKYRKQGIGGSDVAAVYGVSPWKTTKDLYEEKIGNNHGERDEDNWVAKEIGKRLEELVVQIFMKKTGLRPYVIRKMFRHPFYPFMQANIDYFVEIDGKIYIIECKTSFSYQKEEWENDKVPYHYELQGRHYMAVTNVQGVIFLCLYGNSEETFFMRRVERNLELEEDLIEQELYFWNKSVIDRKSPQYTERSVLVLKSIQRHQLLEEGKQIMIPPELSGNIISYMALKDQKAELDRRSRILEDEIRKVYAPVQEALQGAEKGRIEIAGNVYQAGYTKRTSEAINKKNLEALKLKYPEICQEFAETNISRSFYIKKEKAG